MDADFFLSSHVPETLIFGVIKRVGWCKWIQEGRDEEVGRGVT